MKYIIDDEIGFYLSEDFGTENLYQYRTIAKYFRRRKLFRKILSLYELKTKMNDKRGLSRTWYTCTLGKTVLLL